MYLIFFFAFISSLTLAFCDEGEDKAAKRVYAHLLIRDPVSAVAEAKQSLILFPKSKSLQFALIRALSEKGEENEAIEQWKKTIEVFSDEKSNRHLLETLAWGVLQTGDRSSQILIRLSSLLGASLTKDAKAIPMLVEQMRGTNALLRSLAIQLSGTYGDAPLQDELARLLKTEKVWYVRLEVIKAIGLLRMQDMRSDLKEIIGNPKTLAEEKVAAILSLLTMYDSIENEELKNLVKSNRAGLRQLACEVVAHLELKESIGEILSLLKDSSPDVRMSALNAVGLLRVGVYPKIVPLLNDPAPEVAITAAWAAMLAGEKKGEEVLEKWMTDKNPDLRRLASAALAATGKKGIPLSWKIMQESTDPFIRANLALGMIGQREHVGPACDAIYALFSQEKESLWMWDQRLNPLFRSLNVSRLRHIEQIPNYPMVVDQLARLEVLSVLSIMRYPRAQEAVKGFLQNHAWGVPGAAAATLLEEGDEEALSLVRELLKDPEEKIRVQAAVMLALLGKDEAAIKVLQESYLHMDRETKIHILEALGHIGDASSIPFLLEILKEPFQVLRVVAASALIQCLYH